MHVFDTHCDTVYKLWENRELSFTEEDERLEVGLPQMERGNVLIQIFAIYVSDRTHYAARYQTALEMIEVFYEKVAPAVKPILSRADLDDCVLNNRKGAILSIEGAEPIADSLDHLRILYRLGVRAMGLTWNFRNAVADGCLEPRAGGLSLFGRQVIEEMNKLGMVVDVSHLAEPGFWDTVELSSAPIIASHSNTKRYCDHPRNLNDEQIRALIQKDGVMGMVFYPPFVTTEARESEIDDILRHLEHVCELGGVNHVGFGSDFDGIDQYVKGIAKAEQYPHLVEALLKRYKEDEVKQFMSGNWLRVFRNVLK